MFRRFMIVCWVLFFVLGGISLIGLVGNSYYQNLSDEGVSAANAELERKLESGIVSADNPFLDIPFAWTPESKDAEKRSQSFITAAIFSGACALLVLVWSIIWHIGHWIWKGRETR